MVDTDVDRRWIVSDLVETLTERTTEPRPARTAQHILRHTGGGIRLLAVTEDPAAVCFDPSRCCVYHLPVSAIGTHPTDTAIDWPSVADPGSWIDAVEEDIPWVHPRYRGSKPKEKAVWRYRLETCSTTPNI